MLLDSAVESAIEEVVTGLGYELYELKYFSAGGTRVMRVFVDTATGVTLEGCAAVSRAISEYLDEKDFGNVAYTLEVSSPGIDRTLTSQKDFQRMLGKYVQVRYRNESKKQRKVSGELKGVTEEALLIGCDSGDVEVPFLTVLSGKVIVNS